MNEDEQKENIHQLYEEDIDKLLRGEAEYQPFKPSNLSASYSGKFGREDTPNFS